MNRVILLGEPHAKDQYIGLSKRDALLLGARFELGDADRVGRPRVVGQRFTVSGIIVDQVEEDTATAYTVVRPV